jgi:hypothetical protein
MTDIRQAAKAVVDRWDTPAWEWRDQGPTADLMADLRKALAQLEQEPTQWRNMVVVTLVREGINKHKARELADHFATPLAAAQPEQEPVAYDKTEINCFVQDLYDEKMQNGKHGHYETLFHVVHQAIKKVAPPKQQAEPCIGKDPRCPCQDGDACHYKDCGNTKARLVAQPEHEPVADGNKVICPACCHQFRAIPTAVQTLMLNAGFEPPFVTPPAPQRPWLSLTGAEIDANEILRYHFSLNNGPVTRAGMAVVDAVTAMLKAKNHG